MICIGVAWLAWTATAAGQSSSGKARLERSVLSILDSAEPLISAGDLGFHTRDGLVQVVVVVRDNADPRELVDWLRERHARHISFVRNLIQAHVEVATLPSLGDHPAVRWVRRPLYAEVPRLPTSRDKVGRATTQGLAAMNGPAWHAAGITGQGIKVGIVDLGWAGYQELVGSDLPPYSRLSVRTFGAFQQDSDNGHGTRTAEVVYDIVPNAHFYLALCETGVDVLAALEWMRDEGVKVVAESFLFAFCGPGDGTGPFLFPELAELTTRYDMLFVTGAGNYREQHWQGASTDSNGNGWVEFDGGDERMMLVSSDGSSTRFGNGDRITAYLVWNDWSAMDQDYSLHLFRANGSAWAQVAVADATQAGSEDHWPVESLNFRVESAGSYALGVRRKRVDGLHDLEIFTPRTASLEHLVHDGSLMTPADSPHIIATGAVRPSYPYAFFSFSSQGPTNGPGGSITSGTVKPDISGYAEVDTVNGGPSGFSGTSSAYPHVVGAAALVWSARPTWSNLEIRRFLGSVAEDMGQTGRDNLYGAGRLRLGAPIPAMDQCQAELSLYEDGYPPDGGSGSVVVSVAGGCPWFAASHQSWIHVDASDVGSGSVSFTVDRNRTGEPRQGALLVAGEEVAISQAAGTLKPAPRRPRGRR